MTAVDNNKPLIVILGPTASGKSELAMRLAERWSGEIICADSRTVYRELDIGTAKPSMEDQSRIPHWGLDLVEPGERYTAARFKAYATHVIDDIRQRHHIPFLVGGTGLYIDGVLFDYEFDHSYIPDLRQELEGFSIEELHLRCVELNIPLPENSRNKRHLIRAIERKGVSTKRHTTPREDAIVVGIATEDDILRTRIAYRAEQLFENGVVEEAIMLGEKYGWDNEALTGSIYPIVHQYIEGLITKSQCIELFRISDWHLVKRQRTWFRRNHHIHWCGVSDAEKYISHRIARLNKA